ncbi:hypothetical protein V500_00082 [Pseudogymnoascus sp. VKM F-4518 (FW-2643)]|nr:hypothetical protein V500_00082 [Pseudogymnoascus sp. VKM F-4518 (FW-2643)]
MGQHVFSSPGFVVLSPTTVAAHLAHKIFFHPLRSFPGPWYCKASRLWYFLQVARGNINYEVRRLHDEYGETVCIAPNELSYTTPDAWSQIYGRNVQRDGESKPSAAGTVLPKDPIIYGAVFEHAETLVDANGGVYAPQRHTLADAFTRKSLMSKEDTLSSYINHAIEELHKQIKTTDTVDMVSLFNNAVLDFTSKMVVGQDLGAMNAHGTIHSSLKVLNRIIRPLVERRVENGGIENDFVSSMMRFAKDDKDSRAKVINNATILIAAGPLEITSWLCASVYYTLADPSTWSRVCFEIRSSAREASNLNLDLVHNMIYLKACMDESTRMYPSMPGTLTRIVYNGGAHICGRHVPEKTVVGVNPWATYRNANNFNQPDEFRPERWLDENNEYATDRRNSLQPFGYGPRKCIANELSTMYSKLFFARLLWEFDMELQPASCDWDNQKGYLTPYIRPLWVKVTAKADRSQI